MPDSALEDTELQFFDLLDAASGNVPVVIKLYSLTGVPRADRGERHLNSFYYPLDDLWQNQFDGVIITGTEPHHANLQDEPYWACWRRYSTGPSATPLRPFYPVWPRMPACCMATALNVILCPTRCSACLIPSNSWIIR